MHPRTLVARFTIASVGVLLAVGCSATDDAAERLTGTAPPTSDPTTELCVRFPSRDAAAVFTVPADPAVAGDPEVGDQLLEIAAAGLAESAPEPIRPAIDTYVAALRDHEPGSDPMADPAVRSAVEEIDAWLRDHCPAPPATEPPPATAR
jgi:hypothetical protein